MNVRKKIKIALISSNGGHLFQLTRLEKIWHNYVHIWIISKYINVDLPKNEIIFAAYYPDSRNILNFFKNIYLAVKLLKLQKPNVLISCGAAVTVPFFIVGKYLFHARLVFIEPYDFVKKPSLTGKILSNFVDLFLVQHKIQKKWYPKAKYWGSLI